ncbi:MAG: hypothetical protein R3B70_36110 [Polyangiaceae bacterium]
MASFSIELHATVDELISFVKRWMSHPHVFAATVQYHPFEVSLLGVNEVEVALHREGVRRILFSEQAIDCTAEGNNQLLDKNPGALVLDVGRVVPEGMNESRLSTTCASATWRRIANDLKRSTRAGVIGTHEGSGASAVYRNHRYTGGAADAASNGVVWRSFAQSPVILRPAS